MMKEILKSLFDYQALTKTQAKEALVNIGNGRCNNSHIASFMSVFIMRTIAIEELAGFRDALLELCLRVDMSEYNPIDLCGTGGDGKDTFNISTLASFVVAGAGIKVAKHGNYGVSSICGSSNVMEQLGYRFTNNKDTLKKQIETAGICFLHAPLFHPAMKNVAPVRKEMGVKTFFNMLGPMVNPAMPRNQLIGVYNLELARIYNYLYQQSDIRFTILHSLDGYDEISLTGEIKMITNNGESMISPQMLGFKNIHPEEITGGKDLAENAEIFMRILNGKGTEAQSNVVIANAAMAIKCAIPTLTLEDALLSARESLQAGKALKCLNKLIAIK